MMKKNARFKFRRFHYSRMAFSLAVCSFVLVGFSAVAYALAIPPALSDVWSVTAQSMGGFGGASGQDGGTATGSSASQDDPSQNGDEAQLDGDRADGLSATPSFLSGIPAFISTLEDSIEKVKDSPQPGGGTASGNEPGSVPSIPNAGDEQQQPDEPTGLDPAIEAEIHAHLLACFADLEPYYNQVCAGFSNLYATMNDPSRTHVSCAPTNAQALLSACDQGRIRVHAYRYNGSSENILAQSKWYEEAIKLGNCFNDLTNACSVMSEVNGFTVQNAPGVLAKHLNANGEVVPLVEFRERYAALRL